MQDMRDSGKTYVARKPIMQELSSWTLNQARISEYNLSSMILASYRLNSRFIWMIFVPYGIFTVQNFSCFILFYGYITNGHITNGSSLHYLCNQSTAPCDIARIKTWWFFSPPSLCPDPPPLPVDKWWTLPYAQWNAMICLLAVGLPRVPLHPV